MTAFQKRLAHKRWVEAGGAMPGYTGKPLEAFEKVFTSQGRADARNSFGQTIGSDGKGLYTGEINYDNVIHVDSPVSNRIDRDSVSYWGGQYTGADGKMYEKELFGDDYEVGTGVDAKKTGDEKGTDWGMDGYGGVALGAGQLGLGVMSYLENQKTADKQRQVMDQQIENNTFALGTAKKKQAAMDRDFGRRPGGM